MAGAKVVIQKEEICMNGNKHHLGTRNLTFVMLAGGSINSKHSAGNLLRVD